MTQTRALQDLLGNEKFLSLVQAFGGMSLYVPARDNLGVVHSIAQIIGIEHAKRLAHEYGPGTINVPNLKRELAKIQHKQMIERRRAGKTISKIAAEFCCTERWVKIIVARDRDVGVQQRINYGR